MANRVNCLLGGHFSLLFYPNCLGSMQDPILQMSKPGPRGVMQLAWDQDATKGGTATILGPDGRKEGTSSSYSVSGFPL